MKEDMEKIKALIFDCDGVLAETERDGHRVAYNQAFKEYGIDAEWDTLEYAKLVKISGGKERMKAYFSEDTARFPIEQFNDEYIQKLYECKTSIFIDMLMSNKLQFRTGIKRIIKEAYDRKILLFVCSTSHLNSVRSLLKVNLGEENMDYFTELFCGDIVKRKKPSPEIYNLVKSKYGLKGSDCIVIEDSRNGLLAAKRAGMHCIVPPSFYTIDEDFSEADVVVSCLGDPNTSKIRIIKGSNLIKDAEYISIDDLNFIL